MRPILLLVSFLSCCSFLLFLYFFCFTLCRFVLAILTISQLCELGMKKSRRSFDWIPFLNFFHSNLYLILNTHFRLHWQLYLMFILLILFFFSFFFIIAVAALVRMFFPCILCESNCFLWLYIPCFISLFLVRINVFWRLCRSFLVIFLLINVFHVAAGWNSVQLIKWSYLLNANNLRWIDLAMKYC